MGVPGGAPRARPRLRLRLARLPRYPPRVAGALGAFDALRRERGLSLLEVYTQGREHEDLYQLAEALIDWDEQVGVWRFRHVKMVGRVIGEDVVGTQGTPVELLAGLIKHKMFPELWTVRTDLTELAKESDPELIPLEEIRRARERIGDDGPAHAAYPVGARTGGSGSSSSACSRSVFKLRGALSAMRAASSAELADGVVTASAGNMAQGVAWAAREAGVPRARHRPGDAPRAKLDRVEDARRRARSWSRTRSGGRRWSTAAAKASTGCSSIRSTDEAVMAGNGTIGLELDEDAPEFDTVVIPWGGGGLTTGIASAVKALRPEVRVVAAEPATAAPLAASLAAGEPHEIEYQPSWVDGAGGRALAAGDVGTRAASSSTRRCCPARRGRGGGPPARHARPRCRRGAGALALAAALRRDDRCVCIVSGGNIDPRRLAGILSPAASA